MKNIKSNGIFLVSLFMILGLFQARAQYTLTYQNGEPGGGVFQKVAVDGLGNSYYTGTFADSVHFGSVTLYKPASSTGPGQITSWPKWMPVVIGFGQKQSR